TVPRPRYAPGPLRDRLPPARLSVRAHALAPRGRRSRPRHRPREGPRRSLPQLRRARRRPPRRQPPPALRRRRRPCPRRPSPLALGPRRPFSLVRRFARPLLFALPPRLGGFRLRFEARLRQPLSLGLR